MKKAGEKTTEIEQKSSLLIIVSSEWRVYFKGSFKTLKISYHAS